MGCDCGKPKCDGHCGVSPAVLQINNPSECVLFHRVEVPASMGDSKTNPPKSGAYKNVLLYYEADQTSWLYSSDGIPQKLVNGLTDYEDAIHLPQINGVTLLGNKNSADLKLADAPMVITIASGNTSWSGADTAEDIYNFFLDQGKVNVVFEGSENYGYEIVSAAYIPEEQKMMCTLAVAAIAAGETTEFDGNALFGIMTLYTADKAIDVSQIELQPKLYVTDFTGLDLNYNELSGLPATTYSIGMVKAGDGLEVDSDGTLTVIDYVFDTVADMKASTELKNGDYAQTLGFHTFNDGGGATYYITDSGTANEMDVIAIDSLYANLVIPNQLSVKQTGAYGDNTHDDTAEIQRSLDLANNVFVPSGTYLVDATVSLNINSNQTVLLDDNTILQAIPNDQTNYSVVAIDGVDNVNIKGGCIKGDRTDHIGVSGEWGMCLSIINGSSNVIVEDVKLSEAWGDGLYINGASNVTTRDLKISDNRRNGTSIISVDGYVSENDEIKDISGTAPEAGVDIEPNANTDIIKNISFNGLRTSNTKIGVDLSLDNLDATSSPVSIEINNSSDHNSPEGIRIGKSESVIGYVSINSPKLIENTDNAIQFRNARYNSNFVITVNNPYIYRTIVTDNQTQYSAIAIIGQYASGNITIKNPDIHQAQVSGSNIYDFRCNSAVNSDHIRVIDVLHHDKAFSVQTIDHMAIADGCNAFESITQSGAGTVGSYEYRSRSVRNAPSSTGDGTVTISASMPVGLSVEFVNLSQGHYKIQLPADTYCRAYSSSTAPLISISAGGSLTLTRLNTTDFIASGSVGTITA